MNEQLQKLKQDFDVALQNVKDSLKLDELEQKFFSRKSGDLSMIMRQLGTMSDDAKREFGKLANDVRQQMELAFQHKKQELQEQVMGNIAETERIDVTQPRLPVTGKGHLHPVTQVQKQLEDLFTSMGFMVLDGPEVESDYYNFTAVNIPPDHPARDMQDTFYIKGHSNWVMRTHTSTLQVRALQQYGAPLRAVIPGRCFRNEATDARHEHTFYQLEGVVVDTDISFADMKGVLETVAKHLYGEETQVRMRPKFYPFVEPGVNGEVTCFLCKGKGCRVCKGSGWLEIFGAGTCHPNVIREGGLDPKKYQGFAFGFGLTRLVMLKYGIEDIRHLQSGDLRFLSQF